MDAENYGELLYDYRKSVVERKHKSNWIDWTKWDSWGSLYKTLAYERSCSRDVEAYPYVRQAISEHYGSPTDILEYVGDGYTFDIMNGWWHCFKIIFGINTSRKQSVETIKHIMKYIKQNADICQIFSIDKDVFDALEKYLKVVYTVGNITPVPNGCNTHGTDLDNWEYKYTQHKKKFRDGSIKFFHYEDYENQDYIIDFQNKKKEYLDNRIRVIISRGYRILNKGGEISPEDLKKVIAKL